MRLFDYLAEEDKTRRESLELCRLILHTMVDEAYQ